MRRFWDAHSRGWEKVACGTEASNRRRDLVDSVFAMVPRGARIVDLRCGGGHVATELAQRGLRVTAVDFSPAMLERARRRAELRGVSVTFERVDLDRGLPWHTGTFDAAVSVYVIQLVSDAPSFLREAARVVGPDGVVVLEAPARPSPRASLPSLGPGDRVLLEVKRAAAHIPGGVHWFDAEELSQVAEEAGLTPTSIAIRGTSGRMVLRTRRANPG